MPDPTLSDAPPRAQPDRSGVAGPRARLGLRSAADYLAVGLLAFIPMLMSQPGQVTDDTKTYLYLDPGRYIRQAVSLWDPNVALGTVTHENIGYIFPMGPFFWVLAELHVPLWAAQRLWLGALLFAAGAGMIYLCRTIGLNAPGSYVATLGFMFTPYVLQYAGRISVILMPWSGLPWMIAFVVLALRRGGWKYPALFALVVALVSGINASSILYVGIAPALWLVYSVVVVRDTSWRKAWGVAWKVGLLSALVSLWWAIGLQVEAAYGVNILKYTETLPSTSSSSSPFEVVRGLGYWFFYGASDQVGNWTQAAVAYTQHLWLLALSFAVPALAFLAAALVKWRQRAYFVLLIVVGMALAVGPYPYYKPTGFSGLLKAFMGDTTAGLALRSTDRASPLVLIGLAMLLGAGVTAVYRWAKPIGVAVGVFAAAAIAGATAPLWTGATVVTGLTQPAIPPSYVRQAATSLDRTHPGTRVYALPGNNFAAYRWGDTIDTVYPALLTRPFVTHEQQTMGSLPTADLLEAMDTPLQEGVLDPRTIAPMASLMSAGDVLVQYDQAYERYDIPSPQEVAQDLTPTPVGLSDPVSYGTPRPNVSTVAHFDEKALTLVGRQGWTAPLVSYTVSDPRPIVRTESLHEPLVVAGNGSGLANASSFGLLSGNPTVFYSGTLDTNAALRRQVVDRPANLVVTDTNRKQGFRWNGITENAGYTKTEAEGPDLSDPTDAPLNLFPGAPDDAQSTTVFNSIKSVTASSYGSPVQFLVDDRPAAALDGNPHTGWVTAQYPLGQWWRVHFDRPQTASSINLAQALPPVPGEIITKVSLAFDGRAPITAALGPASYKFTGQTIRFPTQSFSALRITITGAALTKHKLAAGYQNTLGFSEVRIPGVDAGETVSMPQDLLRSVGTSSLSDPLSLVMTRLRSAGYPPHGDPEPLLSRQFWLPTARTFSLTGQARVSPVAPDGVIAPVVGDAPSGSSPLATSSSGRLTGDVQAGAMSAVDGNDTTMWEPGFGATGRASSQEGAWLQYTLPQPITVHTLDLKIAADGGHSVPTAITVTVDGVSDHIKLPPVADSPVAGSVVSVPVTLSRPLTGRDIRITVTGVRAEDTVNYDSQLAQTMPIGIAEVGIPGISASPVPTDIPTSCRDDLITVDGSPVWTEVTGTSAAALARQPLQVSLCGPDAGGIALGSGDHVLRSTLGRTVGLDIDQLALTSSPGGGAGALSNDGQLVTPASGSSPTVRVQHQSATSMQLAVSGVSAASAPFELVMGQSINAGWTATVGGHSLGPPVLIDGFANGWRIDPAAVGSAVHGGTMTVAVQWTPQRRVDVALIVSAAAIVACVLLALFPLRRRRARRRVSPGPALAVGAPEASNFPRSTDGVEGSGVAVDGSDGDEPDLVVPGRALGGRTSVSVAVWVGLATGVVAALIAAPLTGLLVGVGTAVALRNPRVRLLLGLLATALVVAGGAYVTVRQGIKHPPANGGWPTGFGRASALIWAGVMFLGADATVEMVMRHLAGSADIPVTEEPPPAAPAPDRTDDQPALRS